MRMHGYDGDFQVDWEEINLQDQVEEAKAELYRQQAARLARGEKNGKTQEKKEEEHGDSDQGSESPGED